MAKLIQFTWAGKRRTLGAAKLTTRQVAKTKELIDLAIKAYGCEDAVLKNEIEDLVPKCPESMVTKLREMGLLETLSTSIPTNLENFIDLYVDHRKDVKPATKETYQQGRTSLLGHFGDVELQSISRAAAQHFKITLERTPANGKTSFMRPSTIKKRIDFARQVFEFAKDSRILDENPFEKVRAKKSQPAEHAEVTREMYEAIYAVCPDQHWRTILTLCRYGGMRCPSEVLSLRWQDVLWDQDRMVVTSPKTEHHPGKHRRVVPLYPEVRTELENSLEIADDGAVYAVHEKFRRAAAKLVDGHENWKNSNLRTTFEKLVWRAGLKPWPLLFHSMRSSRATELLDHFPVHVVAAWQGDSVDTLLRHYAKVRGDHVLQAAGLNADMIARAAAQRCGSVREDAADELHRLDAESAEILAKSAK